MFGFGRGEDFILYLALVSGLYGLVPLYGRMSRLETALTQVACEQAIRDAASPCDPWQEGGAGTASRAPESTG